MKPVQESAPKISSFSNQEPLCLEEWGWVSENWSHPAKVPILLGLLDGFNMD